MFKPFIKNKITSVFPLTYKVFSKYLKKYITFLMFKPCYIKPISYSKTFNIDSNIDFSPISLIQSLNLKVRGVVQVGAHIGQEIESLKLMDKNLHFLVFEPYENCLNFLKDRYLDDPTVQIVGKALGSKKAFGILNLASNEGQSSSLLKPKEHLVKAPHVTFSGSAKVEIDTLDSYKSVVNKCNFLIIDTQGYELEVLKGGEVVIQSIDYIYIEVNRGEVYINCSQFKEVNQFLVERGFHCSHIRWWDLWGDAFYIRINKN